MKKKTMKTITAWIAVLMAIAILPCYAFAEQTATVKGGWLILRSSPSFTGTVLSSYPTGTVVTITGQNGSWYGVTTPDGLNGYMLGSYLQINGGGTAPQPSGTTAYVTSPNGLNVRLRSGPGIGYAVLASYAPGTRCTILSAGTTWSRIQVGMLTGYMMSRYLTGSSPMPPVPPTPTQEYKVYVTSHNGLGVNLRAGAGTGYQSIGFYSVGTQGWMVSPGTTWSYVRFGSRYGYMMSKFLTTNEPLPTPTPVGTAYVVSANGRNVNLRSGPGTTYSIIRSFRPGTSLTIIARGGNGWYFINIGGYYGYMMQQFIKDYSYPYPATGTDYILDGIVTKE